MLFMTPLVVGWGQSRQSVSAQPARFIIDESRPYVYLRFDHMGAGVKFAVDEPPERVWFRFVNNCRVRISLSAFGAPDGSPKDEVGVMHDVVRDSADLILDVSNNPPAPDAKRSDKDEEANMPTGYEFDVGSRVTIPPGKSVLFSIPVTHLSKLWHIEIPYEFDLPSGKGPRLPRVGGEPKMVLFYSIWDLPEDIQQKVLDGR